LSRGGLFIATVKPRDPGEQFTIELTLPAEPKHKIRCRCEVVWKRHFHK
ncbi:MAG: pilus assembly protein PilZ, partial [Phycisphaerae bacterium]|nr:pilus assembly protein PilZ [Gammaproteobacteria bacterium]NIS26000.1 pilus assembly protein PilZ [candidate division KSB1 bacterium]NIV01664.1 pilus assembly protein PilZ [Phycisphaerae bacterium]NIQ10451.1 pilus assembly protein PilZ [Gammaproteobacteria bacterium]NIR25928.1 pilus assembly protein PilZ [Gammaproteobacteria bacterium]